MTIANIPLRDLRLSPLNIRKTRPAAIEALAADIAAHGLLQNLIGYEAESKVHICAGGRRYRALKRLQKDKQLAPGFAVPVDIRTVDEALELSLAENVQREAMHPAEAIIAYRALIEGGMAAESIAARFGVSLDHVRRLLRLSSLHPKLIAALRKDQLSLASAKALAICEDQQRQLDAYRCAGDSAARLRAMLTREKISLASSLFELVGEDSYRQAGGTFTQDLFSGEDERFADDGELVRSLAEDRIAELAARERANGWGTVTASLERPSDYYTLNRLYPDQARELTEEEALRSEQLSQAIAALEAEGVPYHDARIREYEREQRAIEDARRCHSAEQKAEATLYIFLAHHGLEYLPVGPAKRVKRNEGGKQAAPDYPAALLADLGTIRTLAVREAVANNPALALDILLDTMLGQLVGGAYSFEQALDLRLETGIAEAKPELMSASTVAPIEEAVADLLPNMQDGQRLVRLRQMAMEDKLRLLAFCTASQITSSDIGKGKDDAIRAIGQAASLDIAAKWQPVADFYIRLSKPVMLKLLEAHCGKDAAVNCAKLRKADLAAACAERLGPAGYLPPCLTFAAENTETAAMAEPEALPA